MKTLLLPALLLLSALNAYAQPQRLAILPQTVSFGRSGGQLNAVDIDYSAPAPHDDSLVHVYRKQYRADIVRINGVEYPGGLWQLTQGRKPLLLLKPQPGGVTVGINPKSPAAANVRTVRIQVSAPVFAGRQGTDSNVVPARIVLQNYGPYMSQAEFLRRAECLDILDSNGMMDFRKGLLLAPQSRLIMDRLYGLYVLDVFNGATLRAFLDNGLLRINDRGAPTASSAQFMRHAVAYNWQIGRAVENMRSGDPQELLSRQDLITPGNTALTDTMIYGERYILTQAWKSAGFLSYIVYPDTTLPHQDSLPYYVSDATFFSSYAFFVTLAPDVKRWYADIHGDALSPKALRYRLRNVLGLPPFSKNEYFVELWARPQDIFRPAQDSSVAVATLTKKSSAAYLKALGSYMAGSYSSPNLLYRYPFTGMGLTYDSDPGNPSHIGLSEFVIRESRKLYVRHIYTTEAYFRRKQQCGR